MTFVHCLYWRKMEDENEDGVKFEVYQGVISNTTSEDVFYHGTYPGGARAILKQGGFKASGAAPPGGHESDAPDVYEFNNTPLET